MLVLAVLVHMLKCAQLVCRRPARARPRRARGAWQPDGGAHRAPGPGACGPYLAQAARRGRASGGGRAPPRAPGGPQEDGRRRGGASRPTAGHRASGRGALARCAPHHADVRGLGETRRRGRWPPGGSRRPGATGDRAGAVDTRRVLAGRQPSPPLPVSPDAAAWAAPTRTLVAYGGATGAEARALHGR
jgi:hypothetical protein